MTARAIDENGFITVKKNPISRSGVFPYLGKSIGAPEPDKIYNVYRPEEELSNPEALESFKLIPFVDDHTMLGDDEKGLTPAEKKGTHGVTGENLVYEDGVLYADLKIFSKFLSKLIEKGKKQLSLGYRCVFEKASGVFNGESYDYIQRNLRGNHLALVDQARCDVAVLDSTEVFDSFELELQNEELRMEPTEEIKDEAVTLEGLAALVADLASKVDKIMGAEKAEAEKIAGDEDEEEKKKDAEDEDDKEEDKKDAEDKCAMDALEKRIQAVEARSLKAILGEVAKRDQLAKQLSNEIGVFDHSEMTLDEVASYGVKKLQIQAEKGKEHAVLTGYLAARGKQTAVVHAMDAKPTSSEIDAYISGEASK